MHHAIIHFRTGTMSLRAALGDILDGQVYHMLNVAHGEPDDVVHWDKAMKGELTKKEWINFLQGKGFRAGVDYPISIFYKSVTERVMTKQLETFTFTENL